MIVIRGWLGKDYGCFGYNKMSHGKRITEKIYTHYAHIYNKRLRARVGVGVGVGFDKEFRV